MPARITGTAASAPMPIKILRTTSFLMHRLLHPVTRVEVGGYRAAGQGQDRPVAGPVLVEDIEHLLAVTLFPPGRVAGDQRKGQPGSQGQAHLFS